jgi:hypothetical protein
MKKKSAKKKTAKGSKPDFGHQGYSGKKVKYNPAAKDPKTGQWKPGISPSPGGKVQRWKKLAIELQELLDKVPEGSKMQYREALLKKLITKGIAEGDLYAIKLIMNYADGMPRQTIELESEDIQVFIKGPQKPKEI